MSNNYNIREKLTLGGFCVMASSAPVTAVLNLANILPTEYCLPFCLATFALGASVLIGVNVEVFRNL